MNRFFCFSTPGPYEDLARSCIESFKQHGVKVTFKEIERRETWMRACMDRATRLDVLGCYYPADIVGFLDADLICVKEPVLLKQDALFDTNFIECDVAVHDLTDIGRTADHRCQRYCAGVVAFAPTLRGRECLSRWAALCRRDPERNHELREQVYLYTVIEEGKKNGLTVLNIGDKYNRTPDRIRDGDDTVIIHNVASRHLKATHGGGI